MTTEIPNLHQTHLVYASICGFIDPAADERTSQINRESGDLDYDCPALVGGSMHRIDIAVNPHKDGSLHLHVDLATQEFLDEQEIKSRDSGSLDEIQNVFRRFYGCVVKLNLRGMYRSSWESVRPGGLIHGLSQISAKSGSLDLSLNGSEITIKGDSPYRRVVWSKATNVVRGDIFARTESKVSESYLVDAAKMLDGGIRRFILEEPGSD